MSTAERTITYSPEAAEALRVAALFALCRNLDEHGEDLGSITEVALTVAPQTEQLRLTTNDGRVYRLYFTAHLWHLGPQEA